MNKFWTVTDGNTTHTNSRSSRYGTKKGAVDEATRRVEGGKTDEVYVLEAVALVRNKPNPVEVVEI